MSSMGIGNKPCLDIRPSADQINDRSISIAQLSKSTNSKLSRSLSCNVGSDKLKLIFHKYSKGYNKNKPCLETSF